MKLAHVLLRSFLGLTLAVTLVFAWSDAAKGAVDSETCLECHDGMDKTLAVTPHKLASETKNPTSHVECTSCHKGGDVHIEDPSPANITIPAQLTGFEEQKLCFTCHIAHQDLDNYGFDAHTEQELNCSSCHRVHGGKKSLLVDDRAQFCTPCHSSVMTDFAKRSNHPIKQGNMTCLSCHQFTKRNHDNLAYDLNRVCQDCHPQHGGPYLYEHEAVDAYAVDGSGCVECHNPHGSENDRLLRQPDRQLCLQCHTVPPKHLLNLRHGERWKNYDCLTCHTDIHGSFTSDRFLDPDLPAKFGMNCFGCHDQVKK